MAVIKLTNAVWAINNTSIEMSKSQKNNILLGHCSIYAEHIQEVVANTDTFEWLLLDYTRPPSTCTGCSILFANETELWCHQRDHKLLIRKPE